jgi:hypothetical protein
MEKAMTTAEIVQLVASIFGAVGIIIVAIIEWIRIIKSEGKIRKIGFLEIQLKELYGPLYFLTSSNRMLFNLNSGIHNAYQQEFIEKKWSNSPATIDQIRTESEETLNIANKYIEQIKKNNALIFDLLSRFFYLADLGDAEIFSKFILDHTRMNTEIDELGRLKTTLEIYKKLRDISFMRSEFMDVIEKLFMEKRRVWQELTGFKILLSPKNKSK